MKKMFLAFFIFISFSSFAQYHISGRLWYDSDDNHIFTYNEAPLANKHIQITQTDVVVGNSPRVYSLQTDQFGMYDQLVETGNYQVSFNDSFDDLNYSIADFIFVSDPGGNYPFADLIFRPLVPPTYIGAVAISTDANGDVLPPEGGIRNVTVKYGYTDQVYSTMPATIALDFSPKLTMTAASIFPDISVPGHAEWHFQNLAAAVSGPFDNIADTINCTFSFPPAGDTITSFIFRTSFIPGVSLNLIDSSNIYRSYFSFQHTPPISSGITRGVKWMHAFKNVGDLYYASESGRCIDTAFYGDNYFITGNKSRSDSFGVSHNFEFVARINKDGLPVWEKHIEYADLNCNYFITKFLKSTNDGGCVIFGRAYDSATNKEDIAAFKIDSTGNIIWKKKIGNVEYGNIESAVNTADNGFIMTGLTGRREPGYRGIYPDSFINYNLIIVKISASGNLEWKKEYGGSRIDRGINIIALKNGSFLVLGATSSNNGDVVGAHQHSFTVNYFKDSSFSLEGWVLNVDANGNMIWNKCYGGSKDGYFTDAAESAGGILLSGFTNSKDGDLPNYSEYAIPLWLVQISSSGSIEWSKMYKFYNGYQFNDYLVSTMLYNTGPWYKNISPTRDSNFVIGGNMADRYGAIKATHNNSDFSFLKINPAGDIIWQKSVGGTNEETLYACTTDKNDDVIFLGDTQSADDDLYGRNTNSNNNFELVLGKLGVTNVVKGDVFIDNNSNGFKDAGEIFYSNGRVQSAKTKDTTTGYIFNGQFLNNVDTGNYVTRYLPANNYYTYLPATHNTSFTTLDQTDVVNFALQPRPNINDLEIELIPLSVPRPGFENYFRIITKNVGTTTLNNVVPALKKDSRQILLESSRPYTGLAADSVWWGPITLAPFGIDTIEVLLENAAPPVLNNGDTLALSATANPVANDSSAANNRMSVRQIVRGSFDPNDKTEIHGGQLTPLAYSNNEYLQYVIRFQNTGTDTAFFVTVKDTMDAKLDWSTLEVLAASHQYEFRLDKNVATWDFKFIKLTDTLTDEAASHGYLVFKIKPKTGLSVGESFSNKAAIYFDFNLPVITNEEKTFISDGSGICPGGSIQYKSSISGSSYQWQVNNGNGYANISNNTIYSGANTATLQINAAPTSLYGYKYRCLVNGGSYSAESQLKFVTNWKGSTSTDWQNAANWSCGSVPDANTDVIIKSGATNNPVINNNVSCRSIRTSAGVSVLVKAGVQLIVTGNKL